MITQEAAAAMGVSHPYLVTTYKYAIKYYEKRLLSIDLPCCVTAEMTARLVDCIPRGEKDALITQAAAAAMDASHSLVAITALAFRIGLQLTCLVRLQKTRARLVDCVPRGEKDALITQEAAAAMGVSHPHLVTTYKYAIKYHEKQQPHERLEMHDDGKPLLPGTAECWLFMELCNKGTLQVSCCHEQAQHL